MSSSKEMPLSAVDSHRTEVWTSISALIDIRFAMIDTCDVLKIMVLMFLVLALNRTFN